jgi:phage-related protein
MLLYNTIRGVLMDIYDWKTLGGKNLIEEYFLQLSDYEQAEYRKAREVITLHGFAAFAGLNTRQLSGKLWEIKLSQNRIMYVIADSKSVYFLHACKKQKGKAEKFELEKAVRRAKIAELL